ncbi:MAG: hypothetical protein J0L56_15075 [Chitinophagales bacterium]|nr:hypothetical protein [Chitinophagales bacterium]
MPTFLLFLNEKPIEIEYTQLYAGTEKRYVVKVNDVGVVARQNGQVWEVLGRTTIDNDLLQRIGERISEETKLSVL